MLPLFTLTIFLSAGLLFLVQPMFARMVLPLLGGSPAVWNTAMLFYQAALLGGYAYAHWSVKALGLRRQALLHLVLMALVFAVLPIWIPEGRTPSADSSPVLWLLWVLLLGVGLPFFVVSTMSPLLQRWFAALGHRDSKDPYFLYAAGNLGSMLALLAYPLLLEPAFTLPRQSAIWSLIYGVFFIGACSCVVCLLRGGQRPTPGANGPAQPPTEPAASAQDPRKQRFLWILLAFVPSSLMLGVTTLLTTDIAAVPLLWVLPLALYLATFILVFARRPPIPHPWVLRAFPLAVVAQALLLASGSSEPFLLLAGAHLASFFVIALACHGEMARRRPAAERLTEFYLCMSAGGVLGGIFNALLAPLLFTRVIEYPLVLVLACGLIGLTTAGTRQTRMRLADFAVPVLLAALTLGIFRVLQAFPQDAMQVLYGPALGVVLLILYVNARHTLRFCAGLGAVLAIAYALQGPGGQLLYAERTFFGVHRVLLDAESGDFQLMHGNTFHGKQRRESDLSRRIPLAYYYPTGPIGQVFQNRQVLPNRAIAVVGLGSGALAAYSLPQEQWTFYEIDPAVRMIAENTRYFTYLADARAAIDIRVGDARLMLHDAPDHRYGLIILDAYSSDAIPVHLLTQEALQLYLRKLASDGLLAFHISNLHLNLRPLLAALAEELGLHGLYREDTEVAEADEALGKMGSQWALLATSPVPLAPFLKDPRWEPLSRDQPQVRPWSDHYSSILQALRR